MPTEAQIREFEARTTARGAANGAALPGALRAAFAEEPPHLGKLQFRDVMLDDFAWLTALDNPLAHLLDGILAGDNFTKQISPQQLREAVYLWTHGDEDCARLLGVAADGPPTAAGLQAFRNAAARMRTGLGLNQTTALVEAVAANIVRSFSTAVSYGPGGKGENFPVQPAAPRMASAGGSESSAS